MNVTNLMNFGVAVSIRFTFFRQIGRMIDWQRIAQLENDLGADELPELITLFLNEVGGAVSAMDKPTEDDLHFLRGSASTLGLEILPALPDWGKKRLGRMVPSLLTASQSGRRSPQKVPNCF